MQSPNFQERKYKLGRIWKASITHLYILQSHGKYNMQTHIRPLREAHYTYHTPAWVQNWTPMWDTINSNTTMQYSDNTIPVDMTILKFTKAFDTVPHNNLPYKLLKHYGINGNIFKWITNFLKQRCQWVVADGKHSSWTHVDPGVHKEQYLDHYYFFYT